MSGSPLHPIVQAFVRAALHELPDGSFAIAEEGPALLRDRLANERDPKVVGIVAQDIADSSRWGSRRSPRTSRRAGSPPSRSSC
jgi:hypothetical protein